jgi:hypothetical protein
MRISLNEMDAMPVPTKRWARVEYERLVDQAVFQPGDRVELVGGQLLVREASLAFDREYKGSLYARAHVPEYWT